MAPYRNLKNQCYMLRLRVGLFKRDTRVFDYGSLGVRK
jgi:hypothetical protein